MSWLSRKLFNRQDPQSQLSVRKTAGAEQQASTNRAIGSSPTQDSLELTGAERKRSTLRPLMPVPQEKQSWEMLAEEVRTQLYAEMNDPDPQKRPRYIGYQDDMPRRPGATPMAPTLVFTMGGHQYQFGILTWIAERGVLQYSLTRQDFRVQYHYLEKSDGTFHLDLHSPKKAESAFPGREHPPEQIKVRFGPEMEASRRLALDLWQVLKPTIPRDVQSKLQPALTSG